MKLLSIGNSFSIDALAYFSQIANAANIDVEVWHLYIGGCSFERHYNNLKGNLRTYGFSINGEVQADTTLSDVIEHQQFDLITIQQVSHLGGLYASYHPYIDELVSYLRAHQPSAKLWLHKTWAYEIDSTHSGFAAYNRNQQVMYEAIDQICPKIAEELHLDGIIPSGDVIQALRALPSFRYPVEPSLCRDGFHMHLLYGRYAVAATWFETLLGGNILINTYLPTPFGNLEEGALARMEQIRQTVHSLCSQ